MKISEHTEEFTNQVKDLAVMGLTPRQIAERLGLEGEERQEFLMAVTNPNHPLHEAYKLSKEHAEADPYNTLATLADGGDTDALELLAKVNLQRRLDNVKKDLFDL